MYIYVIRVRKESACNAGDLGSIPGLGRSPGEGNGNPLQYSCFLPGEPQEQRSLAGYSPWVTRAGHDLATKPTPLLIHLLYSRN